MNKKEWQREKQKDIALLVVGLVGTLLGSVLIYYLWYTGWFYHLSVESALSSFDETEIEALFGVVLLLQFLSAMCAVSVNTAKSRRSRQMSLPAYTNG